MRKMFFTSKDGTKLHGVWHEGSILNKKAIVLAHGISVDMNEEGIFVDLAERLHKSGFDVFRFDFRGHGESEKKSTEITIKGEIEDLTAAVKLVGKTHKIIGLLGASFGGGVAALYAGDNQENLQALCLWNPVLNYEHTFLNPKDPKIKANTGHLKEDFKTKEVGTLGSKNFKISKKLFEEMNIFFPYESLVKITIPNLIIHGNLDEYVPYQDSLEYSRGVADFKLIEGAGHGFHSKPYDEIAIDNTVAFFMKKLF